MGFGNGDGECVWLGLRLRCGQEARREGASHLLRTCTNTEGRSAYPVRTVSQPLAATGSDHGHQTIVITATLMEMGGVEPARYEVAQMPAFVAHTVTNQVKLQPPGRCAYSRVRYVLYVCLLRNAESREKHGRHDTDASDARAHDLS